MIEWKPVKDYEGIYEVSSDGQIRSLAKRDSLNRFYPPRLLKTNPHGNGYRAFDFRVDGSRERRSMHRLVAETFIGDGGDMHVNHINGDKTDNRVENLEWVSQTENNLHAIKTGLNSRNEKGQFARVG